VSLKIISNFIGFHLMLLNGWDFSRHFLFLKKILNAIYEDNYLNARTSKNK